MSKRISIFDRAGIETLRHEQKLDPHVLRRWRNALLKHFVSDTDAMREVPQTNGIAFHTLELQERRDSDVDGASKLLFRISSGLSIETVILRIASGRTSLCLSSQVGCAAACDFCATGKMGIARNLTRDEMLDQVLISGQILATEQRKIRNIVFMGMGEPFHNEANLQLTLDTLLAADAFHHPPSKILVSTVGVADAMLRCAERFPLVNLGLSLHSVRQDVREQIIPLARKYRLPQLREAIREINAKTSSPIMIEYLMLAELNDSEADARELIEWVTDLRVHVNLIPYNPIAESPHLRGSERSVLEAFASTLKRAGIKTTIRYSLGQDIAAACGQLAKENYVC